MLLPYSEVGSCAPILHVRHEFPLWAAYFRRVLRHVAGFPNLRLLCPIRHLVSIRLLPAYLNAPCTMTPPVPTPFPGSSPLRVPTLTASSSCFIQEPAGLPEFSNASLLACHGLRTPADIRALAMNRALHIAFQHVKTVGIRIGHFEAVPALQGTRFPLRFTSVSVYVYPIHCPQVAQSAMKSTLDTGGSLALTRRGLAPRKRRQASLGAITSGLTVMKGASRHPGT